MKELSFTCEFIELNRGLCDFECAKWHVVMYTAVNSWLKSTKNVDDEMSKPGTHSHLLLIETLCWYQNVLGEEDEMTFCMKNKWKCRIVSVSIQDTFDWGRCGTFTGVFNACMPKNSILLENSIRSTQMGATPLPPSPDRPMITS